MTDETTTAQGTTASPATEPARDEQAVRMQLDADQAEREAERTQLDADELATYRRRDAEQAEADRRVADRNAGQHDPIPPAVVGAVTDDDAAA